MGGEHRIGGGAKAVVMAGADKSKQRVSNFMVASNTVAGEVCVLLLCSCSSCLPSSHANEQARNSDDTKKQDTITQSARRCCFHVSFGHEHKKLPPTSK